MAAAAKGGGVPWSRLSLKLRNVVRETVIALLAGVGTGETRRDRSEVVLHARRRLAPRELAMLTAEWCALPAVGIAGEVTRAAPTPRPARVDRRAVGRHPHP